MIIQYTLSLQFVSAQLQSIHYRKVFIASIKIRMNTLEIKTKQKRTPSPQNVIKCMDSYRLCFAVDNQVEDPTPYCGRLVWSSPIEIQQTILAQGHFPLLLAYKAMILHNPNKSFQLVNLL